MSFDYCANEQWLKGLSRCHLIECWANERASLINPLCLSNGELAGVPMSKNSVVRNHQVDQLELQKSIDTWNHDLVGGLGPGVTCQTMWFSSNFYIN
jgi:hypothetical protein